MLSVSLRNKSERFLWATVVVRTPHPSLDCEVTKRLEAEGTETFTCVQRALVPWKAYQLLVDLYEDEGRTGLLGSPRTIFWFPKSDIDKLGALVPPDESRVWLFPGDRIRVNTSTASRPFTGSIAAIDDTTITLGTARSGSPTVLRRHDITELAVSQGGRGSRGKNTLVGASIGAGIGALLGLTEKDDPALSAGWIAGIGAIAGASTGALIGLFVAEWWKDVPVERIGVGAEPISKRPGLSLTYSF
jgi:hypothetical protein